MYIAHNFVRAKDFLEHLVEAASFSIWIIHTDSSTEFSNALVVTKSNHQQLFEEAVIEMRIARHRIAIATLRHNGIIAPLNRAPTSTCACTVWQMAADSRLSTKES